MLNKLWVQLTLAFSLVTIAGLVIAAFLANYQVSAQFRRFVVHDQMSNPVLLAPLVDYYVQTGSWQGVEHVLDEFRGPGGMGGPWGMGGGMGAPGMRRGAPGLVLADAGGRVVYTRDDSYSGQRLSRQDRASAVPISVNNQVIGYMVIALPPRNELTTAAQTFLDQLNRVLLQAGLIAGGLGILIGLAIARGLSAPLGRLAAAAHRISRGELNQQVPVRGSEEMADVARAFNNMAVALQQAEQLRRNMVADIAHELRTPLTVIQGNLQAILDEIYPLEKAEIAGIYDETLMLSRLVNDLRELAQAEAGQLSLNIQPIDLAAVINSAMSGFEGLAQEQEVGLAVTLPPTIPPILADPDRVRQVLSNLTSNALRHTPPGGRVTITVDRLQTSAASVHISICDTGSGIPPQDLPYIFNRFWRAEKSRSRYEGGSGLGLAIARQLVEAQGGQIGVESKGIPGQGSCFWFTLPITGASVT